MSLERYPADPKGFFEKLESRRVYRSAVDVGGFNLGKALQRITGPAVEINGPSAGGYDIIENQLPSAPVISNIQHYSTRKIKAPHILADAAQLPFDDRSIGMVLANGLYIARPQSEANTRLGLHSIDLAREEYAIYPALPKEQTVRHNPRIEAIEEASRVLRAGGLLVWAAGGVEDMGIAEANGFELCRSREYMVHYGAGATGTVVDAVFRHN